MKKIILLIFTSILLFSCVTTENSTKPVKTSNVTPEVEESVTDNSTRESFSEEQLLVKQDLSLTIIESLDPTYGEFAYLLLELINEKNWDEIVKLTDQKSYNSYVVDSQGSHEDYCMFILDTGYKGVSTNYNLSQIDKAFYHNFYFTDSLLTLEGEYIYPTGEVEFFRVTLLDKQGEVSIIKDF